MHTYYTLFLVSILLLCVMTIMWLVTVSLPCSLLQRNCPMLPAPYPSPSPSVLVWPAHNHHVTTSCLSLFLPVSSMLFWPARHIVLPCPILITISLSCSLSQPDYNIQVWSAHNHVTIYSLLTMSLPWFLYQPNCGMPVRPADNHHPPL